MLTWHNWQSLLGDYEDIQEYIQVIVSHMHFVVVAIQCLAPLFALFFVMSWSDSHSRKPPLLVPLIGYSLQSGVFLLSSIFYEELKADFLMLECIGDFLGGPDMFW